MKAAPAPTQGVDIFPLLRMEGVDCGHLDLDPPYSLHVAGSGRHWLYVVERGGCWFETERDPRSPLRLAAGDVLAVANDAPHLLRDAPTTAKARPVRGLSLSRHPSRELGGSAATSLFVATVPCDSDPLSELFPTLFHVPADGSPSSRRIAGLVRLIEDELADEADEPGSGSVIDRLGDLILVELLRVEMRRASEMNPVWVHGVADATVSRFVARLHAEPGRHWTWESMGRAAGLSRSALDRRFRAVLGQSPNRYLLALRMRLAASELAAGRKSIAEIAADVGYESEAAFHRAFRRTLGLTPGTYGRTLSTMAAAEASSAKPAAKKTGKQIETLGK